MLAFLAAVTLSPACEQHTPVEPPIPYGSVQMTPPADYERWWHDVEACAQRTGDYHAIHWYAVEGVTAFRYGSDPQVLGLWLPSGNRIFIAGLRVQDSLLVRHEQLHALLQTGAHPPLYFEELCGAVVD